MPGEDQRQTDAGYIRFAHFAAGYVFAVGCSGGGLWALVGNHHARELFTLPVFCRRLLARGVLMKWYCFLIPRPSRYVGHNPLARAAISSASRADAVHDRTGFALYGEGAQASAAGQDRLFTSW